jgi:hypothetical protein
MKYLHIKDNKGFYWDGKEYQEIDKINKDSLLVLLNAVETDEFELDPYDENLLVNKAHQVIYENIYSKFEQFLNDKDQFKTEVDSLYKEAVNKYGTEEKDDSDDEVNESDDEDEEEEELDDINSEEIPF